MHFLFSYDKIIKEQGVILMRSAVLKGARKIAFLLSIKGDIPKTIPVKTVSSPQKTPDITPDVNPFFSFDIIPNLL